MKRGGKAEIFVLIGVLFSASAKAAAPDGPADSPYSPIVERNVFNLHAPPPPLNPADLIKKTPPPKITLTGITTILGKKVTFLTTPATKPGAPPESVMLAEGQAQDEIEVKNIDEKAGVVQVVNHGEGQTLDFDHDGVKTGPPMGAPPAGATMFPPPTPPPSNIIPIPGNVVRPLRSLQGRGNPVSQLNNGNSQNAPLSPEEQVAMFEIQRVKFQQDNDPAHRLFPPTEMTPQPGAPAPQ